MTGLQLVPGDLAAPMQPAHPLQAGPGPVGWQVDSLKRCFGADEEFSVAAVSRYPQHTDPDPAEGRTWLATCTETFGAPAFRVWFETPEQAMAAVELHVAAAVADHDEDGGSR